MAKEKDVVVTRGVLIEVLTNALKEQDSRFDQKMKEQFGFQETRFDQKMDDMRVDLRDEIHSCISASEKRMMKHMNDVKIEIIDGITDILDEFVLPPIAELKADMVRVKDRLQMA